MNDGRSQDELDHRWDIHTERQISAAKAGISAVTVLNSGSWLALLTQADKVATLGVNAGQVIWFWGLGACLGTLTWFFSYFSALQQAQHDFYRGRKRHQLALDLAIWGGVACAGSSLFCFLLGVTSLSNLVSQHP